MDILLQNGVYHLSGRLDEYAELDGLKDATSPLTLHIGGISSINSIGIRKLLAFTMSWAPRTMAFFACTPEFIGNLNVIPQMVGKDGSGHPVKSFYVPFYCSNCKRTENELWQRDQVRSDAKGEVVVPPKVCAKCGDAMELDAEPVEYFLFLKR